MKALVTNAAYSNALAAVRSLGRKGVEVHAGSDATPAQSFHSRYCSARTVYPSPRTEQEFVRHIQEYAGRHGIDVILPIGYDATVALSRHLEGWTADAKVPVAPWPSMAVACSKDYTMAFAEDHGVSIPKTYASADDVDAYPVVVKSAKGSGGVRYVHSRQELDTYMSPGSVIQEYIPGEGYGFFALYNQGSLRAMFMHRRVREFPVTGGPSTAADSVRLEDLERAGRRLLDPLKWHGVVMAEFKKDIRDGRYKLMEINPKFWGSLDLAIASGVDFPYLLARMAVDGDIDPVTDYRVGVRFRWPFPGEVMHMLAEPGSAPGFVRECFARNTRSNIDLADIRPNLLQMASTAPMLARALGKGSLRYPDGKPRMV